MNHLYHVRSENLRGSILFPLNELRIQFPDIYEAANQKYIGREELKNTPIHGLNCLWNDVIHLCPIHPSLIRNELVKIPGYKLQALSWFEIPVSALQNKPATYFRTKPIPFNGEYDFSEADFRSFSLESYKPMKAVPKEVVSYYETEIKAGRRPLLFNGIDHVLLKSALDVTGLKIFTW